MTAANDLSLLFKLRGDASGVKTAIAESRAGVAQLRQAFGPELAQTLNVANKAFSGISDNLKVFIAQRLPLVGGAVVRVTENLRAFGSEGGKVDKAITGVAKSIQSMAAESGKSIPQIASFLTKFIQIEGQANRDKASIEFFGASLGTKLLPQLEKTGAELAKVSTETAATGSAMAGLAGPIGIAIIALAAEVAIVAALTKGLFDLAKQTADYQGKLFDLSQQTGVSVETLSALEVAAKRVGGGVEGIIQPLAQFQTKLDEARDSSSKAAQIFRGLGVDVTDTESALRQTLSALAAMPEGFEQTAKARELFGRGGRVFLAILKETRGDIDGVITKLKELGAVVSEEDARAADEFNDELVLLQFQLRGLTALVGREVIPIVLSALKDTQKLLKDNKEAFEALGISIKVVAGLIFAPLKGALIGLNTFLTEHKPKLILIVELYERLAEAIQIIANRGKEVGANAIPEQPLGRIDGIELLRQAQEAFKAALKPFNLQEIFSTKEQEAALEEQLEALEDAIADREAAFQAESEDLARELRDRQIAFKDYIKQSQQANADRLRSTLADLATERAAVKQAQEQGVIEAGAAAKRIRQIDNEVRDAKRAAVKEEQRLKDEQTDFERKQAQATIDVLRDTIATQLQIRASEDAQRIASIRELAKLRVKTEEDAERRILKIRLDAIDREKQLLQTEVSILEKDTTGDPEEVLKQKARLNLRIRVLTTERVGIEQAGERDVEAGRQRDLENERDYETELRQIKERIRDIERDTAQEAIRLMILSFARRKDIIKAQRDEALREEDERHRRETEIIDQEKRETDERIKVLEGYLKNLKVGTAEEIEEHDKLIESLEKLRIKRAELDAQQDAENSRSQTRKRRVEADAAKNEAFAGPGGGFAFGLESGQLKVLEEGVKSFADAATVALSAVGAVVNGLAQGVGSLVQQWVLLGSAGPNAFRKLVASVLAGVAAQAATLAIMELAYGVAALTPWGAAIYGPAPFHFKSAALFGSIAAATALAGRSVAGGLFQPAATGGGTGRGDDRDDRGQLNPLNLARNAGVRGQEQFAPQIQPQRQTVEHVHILRIESNDSHIVKVVSDDYRNGGRTRELILGDGQLRS